MLNLVDKIQSINVVKDFTRLLDFYLKVSKPFKGLLIMTEGSIEVKIIGAAVPLRDSDNNSTSAALLNTDQEHELSKRSV